MQRYHQQLYLRFLRPQESDPDSDDCTEWIKLMMYREFGDKADPVYKPWWKILGLNKPTTDLEEIQSLYRQQSELYASYTYGQEMLALLSLAIAEALNSVITAVFT
jgi:hypothetical protein